MRPLILLVALNLALVRVLGVFGLFDGWHPIVFQIFKDAAHLFVGGLIGGAVMARFIGFYLAAMILSPNATPGTWALSKSVREYERFLRNHAVILSVVETICAVGPRLWAWSGSA
jgi:hypothetical protein